MRAWNPRALRRVLAALALTAPGGACDEQQPIPRHRITFEVYSDLNPLPGAALAIGERVLGQTDARGTLQLVLPGRDGTVVPLTVRCPNGTRSPTEPIPLTLRSVHLIDPAAAARGIVQRVNCPPADRTVAVVVRARGDGVAGLPVMWQGQEVSRTDAAGLAHLTFRARPATQLAFALDTSAQPFLRPQNPTHPLAVPDADGVFVWDQEFRSNAPPPPRRRRRRIFHHMPVRIP